MTIKNLKAKNSREIVLEPEWYREIVTETGEATQYLISQAPDPDEFSKYVNYVLDNIGEKYYSDIDWNFLGFIENYIYLSFIIPKELTVVDVGCGSGFQHVLFKNHKKYIGIDMYGDAIKLFTDNSSFIQQEFSEAIDEKNIEIGDDMFGIANMSILYTPSEMQKKTTEYFNSFKRKFIL